MVDYRPQVPTETSDWLKGLSTRFVEVWIWRKHDQTWLSEEHVDDHDTFLETVDMSLGRHGLRFAAWGDITGWWTLLDKQTGDTKFFPSRDAMEMAVLHAK